MERLDKWHQTKPGLLTFSVIELLITYGFASLAIDQGSWWWYLLTFIFSIGSLQNFLKLIGNKKHGRNEASQT